jgi:hypothetical protein
MALSLVALVYHAGQSRHRTPAQLLQGERDTSVWAGQPDGLPRAALRISEGDRRLYRQFLAVIEAHSDPDESILALPNDAELYFLARRRNPTRFYNSTMGLLRPADVRQLLDDISHRPPRLVIFRPKDKFVTEHALEVMQAVRASYQMIDVIDDAEIYLRPLVR